jgi:uncharacterized LabA/DUF88 family protein
MTTESNRTLVIIDGDNLLVAAKHLGFSIDFAKLRDVLSQSFAALIGIRFYVSSALLANKHHTFYNSLPQLGYELRMNNDRTAKSNIETLMAIDAVSQSDEYNTLVLMSGDRDFVSLLDNLKKRGKQTVVVSLPIVTSLQLRNRADEYINLEELLTASALSRKTKQSYQTTAPPISADATSFYLQKGIYFDSYLKIRNLLKSAEESVTIIDGYVNEEILHTLSILPAEIKCSIITRKITGNDFEVMVSKLRREGRTIKVYKSDIFHDRFIRIDKEWWHLGHSIKDLGSADAILSKVFEPSVIELLLKREAQVTA